MADSMFDVVIGLPSYNEADSIAHVMRQVDKGCSKWFPGMRCLLLNADCTSQDGTREIFLAVPTENSKTCMTVGKGKGTALRCVFEQMVVVGAKYGCCLDTDLMTITGEWVGAMASALKGGAQYVTPAYHRHRVDGTITNLFCCPITAAAFGQMVAQPIGGDFGFSLAAAKEFLKEPWPEAAYSYGIDIYMTTTAFAADLKTAEVELPPKVHKPSLPKLVSMALDVISALLHQVAHHNQRVLKYKKPLKPICHPWVGTKEGFDLPEIIADPTCLKEAAIRLWGQNEEKIKAIAPAKLTEGIQAAVKAGQLDDELLWADVLHFAVKSSAIDGVAETTVIETARISYLLRAVAHVKKVQPMTNADAVKIVDQGVQNLCRKFEEAQGESSPKKARTA